MFKSKSIIVNSKKLFVVFICCILLLFSLSACMKNGYNAIESQKTTENDTISDGNETTDTEEGGDIDISPEDLAQATIGFPSFAYRFALNEEDLESESFDGIDKIEYNGEKINIWCKLTAGGYSEIKIGIRVFINGIIQSLFVANETTNMITTVIEKNESETIKLTFIPNIGNKGDTMELCFDLSSQPDIIKDENESYRFYDDGSAPVGNVKLIMNADSSNIAEKEICDNYSNLSVSKVNELIYQSYATDGDTGETNQYLDNIEIGIYQNIDDYIYIDETDKVICTNYHIRTTASENTDLTLNLHGKPGKYRVSFLLNGKVQRVFDGKGFADVTVESNMQTELKIFIDTMELSKNNKVYIFVYEIADEFNEDNQTIRTAVYPLIITDALSDANTKL